MLVDGRKLSDTTLETRVCVIGGGPAGIAIVLELQKAGIDTILLESGGFEIEEGIQELYRGESTGQFRKPVDREHYLTYSRMRFFGGATNVWFGYCRPHDPYDFKQRDWVPHSGWPITIDAITPYYPHAAELSRVVPLDGNELARETISRRKPLTTSDHEGGFHTQMLYYGTPVPKFGQLYGQQIVASPTTRLILHGNCLELECNEAGNRIESIRVGSLNGNEFRVKARLFVLATGGVENARLLLASDRVHKQGIGNDTDQVGRYFMEHPHVLVGEYVIWGDAPTDALLYSSYTRNPNIGHNSHGVIVTTEDFQRRHRTLNYSCQLVTPVQPNAQLETLLRGANRLDDLFSRYGEPGSAVGTHLIYGSLHAQTEQSPNPESRVILTADRDALGMRKVQLNWQLTQQDFDSIYRSTLELGKYLARTHKGRARLHIYPAGYDSLNVRPGSHHLGTTRMSDDPRTGVVDADCRVHGIPNLYIAGSSVYTTGGYVNPTLTLIALALRLGDHVTSNGLA